ncbi:hypothetical protein [Streptomyces radicis]|uniref:hypothetical protein n=1 Tax=Streptomyces radicis TaxID=1750517 RepID=UPI001E60349D|nr:hypothetical protein [Streptomyces radicis]
MGETPPPSSPYPATPEGVRAALAAHPVVNLTGPLGSGKSWLAGRIGAATVLDLAPPDLAPLASPDLAPSGAGDAVRAALADDTRDPLVLDGVDAPAAVAAVAPVRTGARVRRPVLLVSRRPLLRHPEWTLSAIPTLTVRPWPDGHIDALAAAAQLTDPGARRLVVRLAAGNPLLAAAACRALHAGAAPDAPGAVADRMAGEIVGRLARELPDRRLRRDLPLLATVGAGDETLLRARGERFDALSALSVVTRTPLGLAVTEPFRHIVELAHQWRRPTTHRATRTRAFGYRKKLISATTDVAQRAALMEESLFLTGVTGLRETLFPAARPSATVDAASPADADDIGRMMRRWAQHGGLDPRRTDALADRWVRADIGGFRLVRDTNGQLAGFAGLFDVNARTVTDIEPLFQQHADRLLAPSAEPGGPGGLFLGVAFCPDAALHARLLRYILRQTMSRPTRLLVSTPTPQYQSLLDELRFEDHGATVDDVYRCGRRPMVFSQDFRGEALPAWLERLGSADAAGTGAESRTIGAEVAHALAHLGDHRELAKSPLLSAPRTPTTAALSRWLRDAVQELCDSADPGEAEAGWILRRYHLGPPRTHQQLATQLHLSRATYFRRLQHGLNVLAARLFAEGER